MAFVLVYNPVSGLGRGKVLAEELQKALVKLGEKATLLETHSSREDFGLVCKALNPNDRYVVIGGDGTLHYFLNAAPDCRRLAFLGMGTANVVSIEWELPRKLEAFVALLKSGRDLEFYPGVLDDGTRFLMMYSFGHDAFVLSQVAQKLKNRIGKAAFFVAGIKAMLKYKQPPVLMRCDAGEPFLAYEAIVCRFRHYGGAFRVAPLAHSEGRKLWTLALTRKGVLPTLRYFGRILTGSCKNDSLTRFIPCDEVRFEQGMQGIAAQLDGDFYSIPVQHISVDSQPIYFLVPRDFQDKA